MAAGGPTSENLTKQEHIVKEFIDKSRTYQTNIELIISQFEQLLPQVMADEKIEEAEKTALLKVQEAINELKQVAAAHQRFRDLLFQTRDGKVVAVWSKEVNEAYRLFGEATQKYLDLYVGLDLPGLATPRLDDKLVHVPAVRRLDLRSFLIMPVQYPPRVVLLSADLHKHTPGDDTDYSNISIFHGLAEDVATKANLALKVEPAMLLKQKNMRVTLPLQENKEMVAKRLESVVAKWSEQTKQNWQLQRKSSKGQGDEKLGVGRRLQNVVQSRKEYVIKDELGNTVFRVNVYPDYISIKQTTGLLGRNRYLEQMDQIQQLIKELNSVGRQIPVIHCEELEGISHLVEVGLKDSSAVPYGVGKKEQSVIQVAREKASKQRSEKAKMPTSQFSLEYSGHEVYIDYLPAGTKSDAAYAAVNLRKEEIQQQESAEIKKRFESVIANGFVPVLRNYLEVVGVKKYSTQGSFSGEIKINTKDPLIAIKQYESVLAAGFTPLLTAEAKATLKSYIKEQVRQNSEEKQILIASPTLADPVLSGKIMLNRLEKAVADGFFVDIATPDVWWSYLKTLPEPPEIDLQHFEPEQQILLAKQLALCGVTSKLSAQATGLEIPVQGATPKHAVHIFGSFIKMGFKPTFEESTRNQLTDLMKKPTTLHVELQVGLSESQPKALLDQIRHCCAMGLCVQMNEEKRHMLKAYIEKNGEKIKALLIDGHHASAIKENIALANSLGLRVECTDEAKRANTRPDLLDAVKVEPVYQQSGKGAGKVIDIDKTLEKAINLAHSGYPVQLPNQMQQELEELKKVAASGTLDELAKKRRFLGFGVAGVAKVAKAQLNHLELFAQFNDAKAKSQKAVDVAPAEAKEPVIVAEPHAVTHLADLHPAHPKKAEAASVAPKVEQKESDHIKKKQH